MPPVAMVKLMNICQRTRIEEILLIIAACVPLLKGLLEDALNNHRSELPRFSPDERKHDATSALHPKLEEVLGVP